jgi:hypothetical protein
LVLFELFCWGLHSKVVRGDDRALVWFRQEIPLSLSSHPFLLSHPFGVQLIFIFFFALGTERAVFFFPANFQLKSL